MKRLIMFLPFSLVLLFTISTALAAQTQRIQQFTNDEVTVWETIVYPTASKTLKMHRHEHDRVVVAFDDGLLKVTNDKGKVHYLKFEKEKAYYLSKDVPNELHMDENVTSHPVRVMVIELKNS